MTISSRKLKKDLRELMNIPDNYKVLFLQGGASQFICRSSYEPYEERKKQLILLLVSGLRKHLTKLKYMVRLLLLLPQRIRHIHIFQIAQILIFQRMQIMYISVRITQFMVLSIRHSLIQRDIFLYQMFHHAFYQSL